MRIIKNTDHKMKSLIFRKGKDMSNSEAMCNILGLSEEEYKRIYIPMFEKSETDEEFFRSSVYRNVSCIIEAAVSTDINNKK